MTAPAHKYIFLSSPPYTAAWRYLELSGAGGIGSWLADSAIVRQWAVRARLWVPRTGLRPGLSRPAFQFPAVSREKGAWQLWFQDCQRLTDNKSAPRHVKTDVQTLPFLVHNVKASKQSCSHDQSLSLTIRIYHQKLVHKLRIKPSPFCPSPHPRQGLTSLSIRIHKRPFQ